MKYRYHCLICNEPHGSHITAIHKLVYFYKFAKMKVDNGESNYGYIDERPILFEDN